jgi:hypothetical protein
MIKIEPTQIPTITTRLKWTLVALFLAAILGLTLGWGGVRIAALLFVVWNVFNPLGSKLVLYLASLLFLLAIIALFVAGYSLAEKVLLVSLVLFFLSAVFALWELWWRERQANER